MQSCDELEPMSAQERRPTQHHSQSTSCLLCHYGQYTESESRGNNTELGQTLWVQTVFVAWGITTSNEVTIPTRPTFKKQILTLAMSSPFPSLSNRLKQQHRSSPQSRCSRTNSCNISWQWVGWGLTAQPEDHPTGAPLPLELWQCQQALSSLPGQTQRTKQSYGFE